MIEPLALNAAKAYSFDQMEVNPLLLGAPPKPLNADLNFAGALRAFAEIASPPF